MEELIPTLISFVLGAIITFGGSYFAMSNRLTATETKLDENRKATDDKIDLLRSEVEKHNQLVERVAIVERDVKTAFNRIDENRTDIKDLEKEVKHDNHN